MPSLNLSSDTIDAIVEMYEGGTSARGVARVFGINHTTVGDILRRRGVEIQRGRFGRLPKKPLCQRCGIVLEEVYHNGTVCCICLAREKKIALGPWVWRTE